jgi:hypothetical protein
MELASRTGSTIPQVRDGLPQARDHRCPSHRRIARLGVPRSGGFACSAVSYWTVTATFVVCIVPPPEAVTVTVYAPDGVPKFIWLLPP